MATILVAIEIGNHDAEDILNDPEWYRNGMISVDNAYLQIDQEDDSFYVFPLLGVTDLGIDEIDEIGPDGLGAIELNRDDMVYLFADDSGNEYNPVDLAGDDPMLQAMVQETNKTLKQFMPED